MESVTQSKAIFRETDELREFAVVAGYLYVCFAAVLYLKAAILRAQSVAYAPLGLAAIKAAICVKFMLLGRAFHIGERFKTCIPLFCRRSTSHSPSSRLAADKTICGFCRKTRSRTWRRSEIGSRPGGNFIHVSQRFELDFLGKRYCP